MRILINSINYHPELTGIGKYTGEMAAWAARHGHEVRVVTAPPYYPAWRVGRGYSAYRYRRENMDGVRVYRCPLWVPRVPSGVKRVLHLGAFALACAPIMLWQVLAWRPDVVLVVEPPFFCAPMAWLVARLCGGRAWLHIQDFEVDAAFELGLLHSPILRRAVLALESWMMRRFDIVSSISVRMVDRLADKGIVGARRLLFPNWVDTDRIRPLATTSPMRSELQLAPHICVCLYSGNMGEKQGLDILVDAAKSLANRRDIVFVLCGDGGARPRLERMATGLDNIRFLPLQPLDRLNDLLNMADIHLLPQRAGAADLVMPSKLTAMLASGRSIVATARAGTEIAEVVSVCGSCVEPGDGVGFARAIAELADDRERRARLGAAGRQYAVAHLGQDMILSAALASAACS